MNRQRKLRRRAGVLLHPTSLPGPFGIGTIGSDARRFVDDLVSAGQSVWQILPLNIPGDNGSPYFSYSAFSGNIDLIDPVDLVADGLLDSAEPFKTFYAESIDYDTVASRREQLCQSVKRHVADNKQLQDECEAFCRTHDSWLRPYALFAVLAERFETFSWHTWPKKFRFHDRRTIARFEEDYADDIKDTSMMQWLFFRQWFRLKRYANERGVLLFGDLPMYVSPDSADVWWNQHLFRLKGGLPTDVAGVPPDYFSPTGQLWGNPLYRWSRHKKDGFAWWISRFKHAFSLYNMVRIDHFRGFQACWSVPAGSSTAETGRWVSSPGRELFSALRKVIPDLPIVVEDLGNITPEVLALRDELGFPGMSVLQFAFDGGSDNYFLPHNYPSSNTVCYTGTHDNDTTRGWYESLPEDVRNFFNYYTDMHWGDDASLKMIRVAFGSVAQLAIAPIQDWLNKGSEGRLNTPGTVSTANWSWRMKEHLSSDVVATMKSLTELFHR